MKHIIAIVGVASLFFAEPSAAQIDLKGLIKGKVQSTVEESVSEGVDKTVDKAKEGVANIFMKKGRNPSDSASASKMKGSEKTNVDAVEPGPQVGSGLKSYSKYDFVPGDQILFYEDFSQDAIGDFPALWTTDGNGEVRTLDIGADAVHWLYMAQPGSVYCCTKAVGFPKNFIFEFDIAPDENFQSEIELCLYEDPEGMEINDDLYPGRAGLQIQMNEEAWNTKGYHADSDMEWLEAHSSANPCKPNEVNHVIIWVQGRRVRIYHLGAKVLDSPTNIFSDVKFNRIRFSSSGSECRPFITGIKVTTAAPDTRSKLLTEGKLVSYGILFDTDKAEMKPESYGTVSDVAKVLQDNPEVRIRIVGHTDGDGDEKHNLDLSKRRAEAVKKALTGQFGIDGARIETDGKGEDEPVASNDTSEGKAKNRRVELIRL